MEKFDKTQFIKDGPYLMYGVNRKFVARFKYTLLDRAGFQSFLVKNFTPTEYFAALDAGQAPVTILQSKGYVSATVRRMVKSAGYPETIEGFAAHVRAQCRLTYQRRGQPVPAQFVEV